MSIELPQSLVQMPYQFLAATPATSGAFAPSSTFDLTGYTGVLTDVDVIAYDAEPIQMFVRFYIGGDVGIYYDSQSSGEGIGVRFQWQGRAVIGNGDTYGIDASTASGAITWSGHMTGYVISALGV